MGDRAKAGTVGTPGTGVYKYLMPKQVEEIPREISDI